MAKSNFSSTDGVSGRRKMTTRRSNLTGSGTVATTGTAADFYLTLITPGAGKPLDGTDPITVSFSQPINPGTVSPPQIGGVPVAGGFSYSPDLKSLTFSPASNWPNGSTVTWALGGFASATAQSLTNAFSPSWPVEQPFEVTAYLPPAGTQISGLDPLQITMSGEPVVNTLPIPTEDGLAKAGGWLLGPVLGPPEWDATFTPTVAWAGSAVVSADLTGTVSTAGRPLTPVTANWSVAADPFDFSGIVPAPGSVISFAQPISLSFSDDVDAGASNIQVLEAGQVKPGSLTTVGSNVQFVPLVPWQSGATVTVNYAGAVSLEGVPVGNPGAVSYNGAVTFSFMTSAPLNGGQIYGADQLALTFSEPPQLSTLPLPLEGGISKPGSWILSNSVATFTPASSWLPGETVVLDYSVVQDIYGNSVNNPGALGLTVKNSFTLDASAPTAGGTITGTTPIQLTFSRAPDITTLPAPTNAGVPVTGSWVFITGNTVQFNPAGIWSPGSTIALTYNAIESMDGVVITNPGNLIYTVPASLVQTNVSPVSGSILTGAQTVTVVFNQPVDVSSLPSPLTSGGAPVAGAWAALGNTAAFTPASDWPLSETITVDWTTATDSYGQAVSNAGQASFNTTAGFAQLSVAPVAGDYLVGSAQIQIQFNRPPALGSLYAPSENGSPKPGSWTLAGNSAIFTPSTGWLDGSTIVVDWTGVQDSMGNAVMSPASATYYGASAFTLSSTIPAVGSTLANFDTITLSFTTNVDVSTIPMPRIDGVSITGAWINSGGTAAVFTPDNSWTGGTVTLDYSGVQSLTGQTITNPNVATFSVLVGMILVSSSHATGDVLTGSGSIRLEFSSATSLSEMPPVMLAGAAVAGSWTSADGRTFFFTPATPWPDNGIVSLDLGVISSQSGATVTNASQMYLLANEPFKMEAASPVQGGSIDGTTPITLTFNYAMDATLLPAPTVDGVAKSGSWLASGNTATFIPASGWYGTQIVADFTAIKTALGAIPVSNPGTLSLIFGAPFAVSATVPVVNGELYGADPVEITFSQNVNIATAPIVTSPTGQVTGTWAHAAGDLTTAVFTPANAWVPGQTYSFNMASFKSTAGISAQYVGTFDFTAGTQLSFIESIPVDGGTISDDDTITLVFSQPVNVASLLPPQDQSLNSVPGNWRALGDTAVFTPAGDWPLSDAITVNYSLAVDLNGQSIINGSTLTINTEAAFQHNAVIPVSGSRLVGRAPVTLDFNRAPVQVSLPPVLEDGAQKLGSWSIIGDNATFTPTNPWGDGTNIVVSWAGVIDTAGRTINNGGSATFIGTLEMQLMSSTPPGGTAVYGSAPFTLTFNDDVAPATLPTPTVAGSNVSGSWSVSGGAAEFTPSGYWSGNTITVDYSGVQSIYGVPIINPGAYTLLVDMRLTTWSQATGTPVIGNSAISLTFSDLTTTAQMPTPQVEGVNVPGSWSSGDGLTFAFTPFSTWPSGVMTVDLAGIQSIANRTISNASVLTAQAGGPFQLVSTTPVDSSAIMGTTPIVLTFSAPPLSSTLPNVRANGVAVPGSWAVSLNVATFTPTSAWADATITIDYSGITASNGVYTIDNGGTLTFDGTVFELLSTTPTQNAEISGLSTINVEFNAPPNGSSIGTPKIDGVNAVGSWSVSGNIATFTPANVWTGNTITVDLSAVTTQTGGYVVTNGGTLTLTAQAFRLVSSTPSEGSYISDLTPIVMTFNAPPLLSSLSTPTSDGLSVAGSWSISGVAATFTPSSSWAGDTIVVPYNAVVTAVGSYGITNGGSLSLTASATFSLVSSNAVDGGKHVYDAPLELQFSRPVDLSAGTPLVFGGPEELIQEEVVIGNSAAVNATWDSGGYVGIPAPRDASRAEVAVKYYGNGIFETIKIRYNTEGRRPRSGDAVADVGMVPILRGDEIANFAYDVLRGNGNLADRTIYTAGLEIKYFSNDNGGFWENPPGKPNTAVYRPGPRSGEGLFTRNAVYSFNPDEFRDDTGVSPGYGKDFMFTPSLDFGISYIGPSGNIMQSQPLVVTFSDSVDSATLPPVTSGGAAVAGAWTLFDSKTAVFTPTTTWPSSTVSFNSSGIKDLSGNEVISPRTVTRPVISGSFSLSSVDTIGGVSFTSTGAGGITAGTILTGSDYSEVAALSPDGVASGYYHTAFTAVNGTKQGQATAPRAYARETGDPVSLWMVKQTGLAEGTQITLHPDRVRSADGVYELTLADTVTHENYDVPAPISRLSQPDGSLRVTFSSPIMLGSGPVIEEVRYRNDGSGGVFDTTSNYTYSLSADGLQLTMTPKAGFDFDLDPSYPNDFIRMRAGGMRDKATAFPLFYDLAYTLVT